MLRVVLVFDPALKVDTAAMAAEWANDAEVRPHLAGQPETGRRTPTVYLPGLVEDVVIPLAVNLGSSGLLEITKRLLAKYRPDGKAAIEVLDTADGEKTIVVTEEETPS